MGLLYRTDSHHYTMKFLLLIAAIGFASAAVTCDECKAAAAGLVERLTTDASLEEQAGILIATICPQAPDAAACEAAITEWWDDIAKCLFPEFLGAVKSVSSWVCVRRTTLW